MDAFQYVCLIQNLRPVHRLLRQGVQISGILQKGCESEETHDLGAKIGGVNLVSGQNPHDFEIICPASGCDRTTRTGLYPVGNSRLALERT